jgi:oligopeptide transport system ATP-binding protein
MTPIIKAEDLKKYFLIERPSLFNILSKKSLFVYAVDGVSFEIQKGETYGLVGESGCGKTTIGRLLLNLLEPTSGRIYFKGENIQSFNKTKMKQFRRSAQIIFQDPFASLDPRMPVKKIIGEAIDIHKLSEGEEKLTAIKHLLERVGLNPADQFMDRYPHEFSGGQKQRIGIARALSVNPEFIVADEPVSSLDMSVRAAVLNLMKDLQKDLELTYLLISHDLAVVRHMSNRIGVLYMGKKIEEIHTRNLMNANHPYTQALLSAFPRIDLNIKRKLVKIKGEIPSSINVPTGCRFHTRCPCKEKICVEQEPQIKEISKDHFIACHMFS